MKRILTLSLAFAIFLIPSLHPYASGKSSAIERYLVVGFDDAAQNTDVVAVVSYQHGSNRLSLLQIPRDTYYEFGGVQCKLNQLFPYVLAGRDSKAAREEAMRVLSSAVSSFLGVPINSFVGVSIADFASMIDAIGGVPMFLDREITYRDEETGELVRLPSGERLLSGKEASAFVRYRIGYSGGDLARIDAQKVFISALLRKFGSGLSISTLLKILSQLRSGTVTDIPISLAIRCGLRFLRSYSKTDIRYLTLPGEHCMHGGISYYVANRACCETAVSEQLCFSESRPTFDPESKLLMATDTNMTEIYRRESVPYHVYTDAELRLDS